METNNKNKNLNVPPLRFKEFEDEYIPYKLGEVSIKVGSGVTPIGGSNVYQQTGHYFIRSQNIGNGVLLLDDVAFIDEKTHRRQISTEIQNNDVLLNITGASIGRCAVATQQIVGGNVNQHVCIIRLKQIANPYYICNFILSQRGQTQIDSFQAGGNRQGLNFEQIKSFSLNLPTRKEQDKIAKLLSLLDERISTQIKVIEDLKKLKNAIREKYFKTIQKKYGLNMSIKDLLNYEQPNQYIVEDTTYLTDTQLTPVLTANKSFILGYTKETSGIYKKGDCIIFDDFTLDCKFVSFSFKVKSSAIKILTSKGSRSSLRYVYEYLQYLGLSSEDHKRHYISEIEQMTIAYPFDESEVIQISNTLELYDKKIDAEYRYNQILQSQKQYLLQQMFI